MPAPKKKAAWALGPRVLIRPPILFGGRLAQSDAY